MKISVLLGLSFVFLVSSVFAIDAHDEETHSHPPAFDKWAPQPPPPPLKMDSKFKQTVEDYLKAWQEGNFKAMYPHEDWKGGVTFAEDKYAQTLDTGFKIHTWEITRVVPLQEPDQYQVLVLITHNPPKQIAAFVAPGMTVRSTLRQWWQKKGDKFVHLFNIERNELAKMGMPPQVKDALATPSTAQ